MESAAPDEPEMERLRRQRNLFAAAALAMLASVALAVPRRVASHAELKTLDANLIELQREIVEVQRQIRVAQVQITAVQDEIGKSHAK
jgi:hypothetical protein